MLIFRVLFYVTFNVPTFSSNDLKCGAFLWERGKGGKGRSKKERKVKEGEKGRNREREEKKGELRRGRRKREK